MLCATIAWRNEFKPESIAAADVLMQGCTGKVYVHGVDREGRPIIVMRPGYENMPGHPDNMRNLVFTLERACAESGDSKFCVLLDFSHYSIAKFPSLATSKATLSVLQDHYPERLGMAVIVNPPQLFSALYSAISPFVDPVTRAKIMFVKGEKQLHQQIDPAQISLSLGGTAQEFDPDVYYPGGLTAEARAERQRFVKTL